MGSFTGDSPKPGVDREHPIDNKVSGNYVGHVQSYLESGGLEPKMPAPLLLLTTKNRRTGSWYRVAVFFAEHEGNIVLLASNRAQEQTPNWYENLVVNPSVSVQIGEKVLPLVAHVATAEERPGLWNALTTVFPPYVEHQAKLEREIAIVVLSPES